MRELFTNSINNSITQSSSSSFVRRPIEYIRTMITSTAVVVVSLSLMVHSTCSFTTPTFTTTISSSTSLSRTKARFGISKENILNQQHQQYQQQTKRRSSFLLEKALDDTEKGTTSGTNNNHVYDCLIIGGGISGSTLAHNLYVSGTKNIVLAEARDYLGGNVKSHETADGFIWEEGPNSFATQPSIVRIAYELGIDNEFVFANEALPPWVNHNGKLHPLPKGQGSKGPKGQLELLFGPNGILKFALTSELLSWPGKIRAGIGAFLGHASPPEQKDTESIRQWITRTLGEEVFLRCIDPFVSGVYAGDPQTLSMKAALPKIARIEDIAYSIEWNKFGAIFYGGLVRQIELTKERKADPPAPEWVEFEYGNPGSFRKGLATLPNAIRNELGQPLDTTDVVEGSKLRLQWKIIKVEKDSSSDLNYYIATFDTPNGQQKVVTKSIVSTIPAHAIQGIFTSILPEVDEICQYERTEINRTGIYYPPVAAVTVAYPKSAFKDIELPNGFGNLQNLPGFGNLNPRSEGVRTLGTLWSSSLFPGRAPDDYNLLLNYIGGSRDVNIATLSEDEIIKEVDKGCRAVLLKDDAPAPKVLGLKVWPTAIPQYEIGHLDLIAKLERAEQQRTPGLWICGNYRTGVAFPDCVTFGYEHAKIVNQYLNPQKVQQESTTTSSSSSTTTTSSSSSVSTSHDKSNKDEKAATAPPATLAYFLTEAPKPNNNDISVTTDTPEEATAIKVVASK